MLDPESLYWLTKDPEKWEEYSEYRMFQNFIREMECVNDTAEREVLLTKITYL